MSTKCENCGKENAKLKKMDMLQLEKYFCDEKCYLELKKKQEAEGYCEFC